MRNLLYFKSVWFVIKTIVSYIILYKYSLDIYVVLYIFK